jgi:hypothetical protein
MLSHSKQVCQKLGYSDLKFFGYNMGSLMKSSKALGISQFTSDLAQLISAKLKRCGKVLKVWQNNLPRLARTIENTKLVIELLDKIEESRGLEVHEWNFWDILKHHLTNLLEWRRIYWKQRGTIKWVTNGDAGTNFFHANATIKHKQNFITTLDDNFGNVLSGHEEKAALLWEAYKQRLGTSEFSHIYFDLSSLLEPVENLSCLEEPFLKEEIEGIIRDLSSDKSPSHDGFNGEFLRKCWPTVSKEFQWRFFDENICLQSINSSHIVLIPKKDNPCKVGVLRPISLLNSSIKLLTKILATRLKVIT